MLPEIKISLQVIAYYITSDTHIRKMGWITDDTAEILKLKNCKVGKFAEILENKQSKR